MFIEAVGKCAEVSPALKFGLSALGSNSARIKPRDTKRCEGSIDLDTHLKDAYPSDARWDYVLGYDGRSYFVEVHPATEGEVKVVVDINATLKGYQSDG
jgi:hypothetical protein